MYSQKHSARVRRRHSPVLQHSDALFLSRAVAATAAMLSLHHVCRPNHPLFGPIPNVGDRRRLCVCLPNLPSDSQRRVRQRVVWVVDIHVAVSLALIHTRSRVLLGPGRGEKVVESTSQVLVDVAGLHWVWFVYQSVKWRFTLSSDPIVVVVFFTPLHVFMF